MKFPSILGALFFCTLLPGQYACYLTESCEDLQTSAEEQIQPVAQQNLSCTTDADCVVTTGGSDGECATSCGIVTNKAGAAAVVSAAVSACSDYRAKGCVMPALPCIAEAPTCSAGTCI
jgi:hypothetical protein